MTDCGDRLSTGIPRMLIDIAIDTRYSYFDSDKQWRI